MKKFIVFVLILVMTPMSPMTISLASNDGEIQNLSTATACQVSLQSIWKVYGVPHPCFVMGAKLSISAPNKTKFDSHLLIKVNSDIEYIAWGSIVAISNYALGLNSVEFGVADESGNFVQFGQELHFIIYPSPNNFFSLQQVSSGSPYVIVLRDGVNVSSLTSEVGINEKSYMISTVAEGKIKTPATSSIVVMDLDPSQLILMQNNSNVTAIAPQQIRYLSDVQSNPP